MFPQFKIVNPRCYFCGVVSKAKELSTGVRNHLALHTKEKSYKCCQCGKSHRTFLSLRRHELKIHGGRGFICACQTLFRSRSEFIEHNNKIHKRITKRDIKCPKCRWKFHNNKDLLRHLNAHGRKKRQSVLVKCPECSKTLKDSSLQPHIRQVHNKERNHQCGLCPLKFYTPHALTSHVRIHTGEQDLRKCYEPGCNEVCDSMGQLKAHKRKVHEIGEPARRIVCPHCTKEFNKKDLKRHVERVHMKLIKHNCKFCSKGFYDKTGLKAHTVVHTNEKPYQCHWPGCDMRFAGSGHFYAHIKRHEDKESTDTFPCTEANCGKVFGTRSQLRGHSYSWHKFALLKCYFCGILKKSRTCLMQHMATKHLKERGIKCGKCSESFYTKGGLTAHIDLKHGGRIKPCYFCGKKLASYNVTRHFGTHTREKPYQCGFCKMEFCMKCAAQRHVKLNHLRADNLKEVKKHVLELNGQVESRWVKLAELCFNV